MKISSLLTKYRNRRENHRDRRQDRRRTRRRRFAVESASVDLQTGGLDAALAVISVCNHNLWLACRES